MTPRARNWIDGLFLAMLFAMFAGFIVGVAVIVVRIMESAR